MNCPNCNNPIGCSCTGGSSLVLASDQKQICTKCKDTYEANLVVKLMDVRFTTYDQDPHKAN